MALSDVCIRVSAEDPDLAELYPEQQPFLFASPVRWRDGGADPLSGVLVFTHAAGHLHYVSFGLREVGFEFELTFRLGGGCSSRSRASPDEPVVAPATLPSWPVRFMNEFARHAILSGRPFGPGHYLCLPRPVDPEGRLRCGVLLPDPQLGRDTGAWLQIVGLHERELAAVSGDGYEAFLQELRAHRPLLVTAPDRPPLRRG